MACNRKYFMVQTDCDIHICINSRSNNYKLYIYERDALHVFTHALISKHQME
jgi:hypothetical protein